jgi:hypothetical protein
MVGGEGCPARDRYAIYQSSLRDDGRVGQVSCTVENLDHRHEEEIG